MMFRGDHIQPISKHTGKRHEPMLSRKDIAESWGVSVSTIDSYFRRDLCKPPVSDTTTYGARSSCIYPRSQVLAWKKRIQENNK